MKSIGQIFFLFLFFCVTVDTSHAARKKSKNLNYYPNKYASAVIDADTGHVLYSKNFETSRYPASLTKMMTLYLLFDALEQGRVSLHQHLRVSKKAQYIEPSKLGLKAGETITVHQAIQALVVKSANDVAIVVAENLGGSVQNFSKLMTSKARLLGMTKTVFKNPHGLHNKGQKTTARDMTVLARSLLEHHPKYYHYFDNKYFTFRGKKIRGHNKLLGKGGVDGMKTGYIRASGFNLATSAKLNGRRLIVVVFGGKTAKWRNQKVHKLVQKGFSILEPIKVSMYKTPPVPVSNKYNYDLALNNQSSENKRIHHHQNTVVNVKSWSIQVGSFKDMEIASQKAHHVQQLLPKNLVNSQLGIIEAEYGSISLYRSRLYGFNQRTSYQACDYLENKGFNCVVVSPERQNKSRVADNRLY